MKKVTLCAFAALSLLPLTAACSAKAEPAPEQPKGHTFAYWDGEEAATKPHAIYSEADKSSAPVVSLSMGQLVAVMDTVAGGDWVKVIDVVSGKEGYAHKEDVNLYVCVEPTVMELADSDADAGTYSNEGTTWTLWKSGDEVCAVCSNMIVRPNGSMQTSENSYRGTAYPGYILLTAMTDYDGTNPVALDEPIVLYQDPVDGGIWYNGASLADDSAW